MMPKKVKKRRQLQTDDGVDAGWEEYFDYIFPDDQGSSYRSPDVVAKLFVDYKCLTFFFALFF